MSYDDEAIVRNAYHTAEGNVLDIPGWVGSFTEDGVFVNVTGEESYRGEHLKDIVCLLWSASTLKPWRLGTCCF